MSGSAESRLPRRSFLRYGALGAAIVLPTPVGALCSTTEQTPPFGDSPQMDELSIQELQKKMTDGEETATSLTQAYLARIDAIDRKGPALLSILETNPDALAIAAALDAERK